MSEQLRNATASVHQSLEAFLIPLIKRTSTVPEYLALLHMFYGFYKPLEDRIERFPISSVLTDWTDRRKASLIMDDIRSLGGEITPLLATSLPSLDTEAQAFGALYVLEGSTLGGLIISKMLKRNLQPAPAEGFSFFSGYGEATQQRWHDFRTVLDSYTNDPLQYPDVEAAAYRTFSSLQKWAEQTYRYERAKEKL